MCDLVYNNNLAFSNETVEVTGISHFNPYPDETNSRRQTKGNLVVKMFQLEEVIAKTNFHQKNKEKIRHWK